VPDEPAAHMSACQVPLSVNSPGRLSDSLKLLKIPFHGKFVAAPRVRRIPPQRFCIRLSYGRSENILCAEPTSLPERS
jgi:hypothetical protein